MNDSQKQDFSTFDKISFFATGVNTETISNCPTGTYKKYKTAGILIFIPAILAILSVSIAATYLTDNIFLAILGGLLFAIIIFFIDRAIFILTKPGKFNFGFIFRIALIFSLSIVLAEPLVLILFKGAINNEIKIKKFTKEDEVLKKIEYKIAKKETEISKQKERLNELEINFLKEIDGSGGSLNRGIGKVAKVKESVYLNKRSAFEKFEAAALKEIASLKQQKKGKSDIIQSLEVDLSVSLNALHDLMQSDTTIRWSTNLIRLILILIDLIPVSLKLIFKDEDMEILSHMEQDEREIAIKIMIEKRGDREEIQRLEKYLELEKKKSDLELAIFKNESNHFIKLAIFLSDFLNKIKKLKQKYPSFGGGDDIDKVLKETKLVLNNCTTIIRDLRA